MSSDIDWKIIAEMLVSIPVDFGVVSAFSIELCSLNLLLAIISPFPAFCLSQTQAHCHSCYYIIALYKGENIYPHINVFYLL